MRIVAFDTETTGTDPEHDRIVEICLVEKGAPAVTFRVNPGVPIPPAATAVHGIRDEDVRDSPAFAEVAPKVQASVDGAVLLGYNSRSFDTLLLNHELKRAGQPGLDLDRVREIDVMRLWHALEPRTLTGAVRRWLGEDHAGAHDARADVEATLRIWERMAEHHGLDTWDGIRLTAPPNEVDREGKFVLDDEGHVCFNFGQHVGQRASQVDRSYLDWIMRSPRFSTGTKAIVSRLLEHGGDLPEVAARRARRRSLR
jgi:DNA polymerase-3 subunit epsilon